tara:strand:- start:706 stop:1038 length:333 start_codon:yes stop_codon:yes gene_type:complete
MNMTRKFPKPIKVIILLFGGLLLLGCQQNSATRLETFQTENGWGYVVKKNERTFIRQDIIPAVFGNQSFSAKEDAEKTGQLVIQKIRAGQHPSVTVNELDSLNIFYLTVQ